MNCPTCQTPIPDKLLSCPVCAERKSRAMLLERQKEFLPAILAGSREITLTRAGPEPRWHILLTGVPRHTFCGTRAHLAWRRRRSCFTELSSIAVCGSCHDALQRLAREISAAEVA